MDDQTFPVVLYARVSEVRGARSTSVDDQLAGGRAWAEREYWPVVGEYRDDNISASRFAEGKARPDWKRALDAIATGKARAILMFEFSRGTRDMEVYAELARVLRKHRAYLGYDGRLRDPNSSSDAFAMGLDALSAERHSNETSERGLRAVKSRARRGRPHAALPYGYRRLRNPNTGQVTTYEIDPVTGPIVREIADRLLAGDPTDSADAIAADLNRRGVPTPASGRCAKTCGCRHANGRADPTWEGEHTTVGGRWIGGNLSKLVMRHAYAGLRTHNGEIIPGVATAWPPIIEPAERDRLVAKYEDPSRDKFRVDTHVKHLGTGIYRCGRDGCAGRMRVVRDAGRPNRYDCRECHRVSRHQEPVDDWVELGIIRRLSEPDVLDVFSPPDASERRKAAEAEVVALKAEQAKQRRLLADGLIDLDDVAAWRKGWKPRIEAAEAAARPPVVPDGVKEMAGPDAARRWEDATVTQRRIVLDALAVVTILPTGRKGGIPQPFNPDLIRIEWRGTS